MRHNLWLTAYILSLIRAPGSTNQDDVRIVEPFFSGCNRLFGWRLRSFGRALILNPQFNINILIKYTNMTSVYQVCLKFKTQYNVHSTDEVMCLDGVSDRNPQTSRCNL